MSAQHPRGATYVLRLPIHLVERVRETILDVPGSPYCDLSEYLTVAAENLLQLELANHDERWAEVTGRQSTVEESPGTVRPFADRSSSTISPLLNRLDSYTGPVLPANPSDSPLFVLTNRFSPMLVALRVLANLTLLDGPPPLDYLLKEAGSCARALGLQLRATDRAQGAKGLNRRAVAWPTGDNEEKALNRYQWSFVLSTSANGHQGPLADCGLAVVQDSHVYLTDLGVKAAIAANPLLDEGDGWTLGRDQQDALLAAIKKMPGELAEVALFLHAVQSTGGSQQLIDRELGSAHSDWSANRVTAHRAAMLGRLRELGVLDVHGWGSDARIEALDLAADFSDKGRGE